MFDWLLQLFGIEPEHGMGALENPEDPRDVLASSFQSQNDLPRKHITDISMLPRYDQKRHGSCVGHAIALAIAYYDWKELGKLTKPSPRFIYGLAKRIDGLASQGTYPRMGGAVAKDYGCATENTVPNKSELPYEDYIGFELIEAMVGDAFPRRIGGYAFVMNTIDSLKNAIINNGVVCASLSVGSWSRLPVKSGNNGRHYILIYGYDDEKFYFANSWGLDWGDKKLGNGYFKWNEFADSIRDIMVITDIPNEIMQQSKDKWKYKYFKPTEKTGSYGTCLDLHPNLLTLLDKARGLADVPFLLTSGFRTPEINKKVGGVPNSAHTRGLAADIYCRDRQTRDKMVQAFKDTGIPCFLELAKSHIHVDIDSSIHSMGKIIESDDD